MPPTTHRRCASDTDWSFVQAHECDPLLDTSLQLQITCSSSAASASPPAHASSTSATLGTVVAAVPRDSCDTDLDAYDVIETSRPSFAQIAALKSAQSSHRATQIQRPTVVDRGGASTGGTGRGGMGLSAAVAMGTTGWKYGNEYNLKKSGKKYVFRE